MNIQLATIIRKSELCVFFGIGQLLYFSRNNINQEAEYYNISMYFGILKRNYLYVQINWCEKPKQIGAE